MRLVFDFGGVVFRWKPHELLQRVLPQRAMDETAARALAAVFFQGHGDGDWAQFDRGTLGEDELVPRLAARTGLDAASVRRVVDAVPAELQPLADTVGWIERLSAAGHTLHFLSNMPRPMADHLVRSHPFLGRFASGVFSSHVRLLKPEPEIFAHSARQFDMSPDGLILLDDTQVNVDAAIAAGWQALHFRDAPSCEAALRERGLFPRQPESTQP
jgi:putative hydrolase of the HAD superfamily